LRKLWISNCTRGEILFNVRRGHTRRPGSNSHSSHARTGAGNPSSSSPAYESRAAARLSRW
jgi:hypothetical protein